MSRGILIVAPYLPWPADFGGAIRIYEFIQHLSHKHHVILLAPAAPSDMAAIEHLGGICDVTAVPADWTFRQAAGLDKRLTQARSMMSRSSFVTLASRDEQFQAVMDRLFMTRHIDLVQYEFPQMAQYRPMRPCPSILDNHNVEHELLVRIARSSQSLPQRAFNNIEWRKVRRLEHDAWASMTLNITTSERDAQLIKAETGVTVPVIPNGVDVNAFSTISRAEQVSGRVVFVGAMRHQPNASGARWYAQQVHPLVVEAIPGSTFQIVGADPPPSVTALASDSITVTGRVDSVVPYLAQAAVAVVPLEAGGGTRLKALEAFAAGIPVVSTSLGVEGIDVARDRHLLIADNPRDFADAVIRILHGVELPAGYRTENALELVETTYDWKRSIVPALIGAHDQAIERFEQCQASERQRGSTS